MKKIILLILLFVTTITIPSTSAGTIFRFDYDQRVTEYYHNALRHTHIIGEINYNGTVTSQKVNYLSGNPTTSDNLHVIVGDNYLDHGWGRGTLETQKDNIHERYQDYEVLGGVNGDFYGTNGIPIEAYVRDFEVLSMGLGVNRTVVGFKDNGEVVFGRPGFEGYETIVFDEDGNIKHRMPIEGINTMPATEGGLTVFFENHEQTIPEGPNKVVIGATNSKFDDYDRTFFSKGHMVDETSDAIDVNLQRFILVGDSLNADGLFTATDTVIVQQRMSGDFEDVRFAVGAWEQLVKDGVTTEYHSEGAGPNFRHPRTAIGVKEDGTVFFLTVDGRDFSNGFHGVTAYELSEIMAHFGAVDAYNLDGGGSTAMLLMDHDGDYHYKNTPSDGQPRAVTNGLFFVRGAHDPAPAELPYPDTRQTLPTPENVRITEDEAIVFDAVDNASGYEIEINGIRYFNEQNSVSLPLSPGENQIRIRASGDTVDYKNSDFTQTISYTFYNEPMRDILEAFRRFTKNRLD